MDLNSRLIDYVSNLSKVPKDEISCETELYNSSIISSLNLLEMISYIEKEFNIVVRPEDMIELNFKDIKTLAGFIQSRMTS